MANSKPQPILSHMPRHIKEKIVNLLHTVHKLPLRQCSKEFKSVVDQSTMTYDSLELVWEQSKNAIKISRIDSGGDDRRERDCAYRITDVEFKPRRKGFLKYNVFKESAVFVKNGDFIGAAVELFVKILRNPKVLIEELAIVLEDGIGGRDELYNQRRERIMDKLNESLGALGHRVAVRHLRIYSDVNANNIRRVLPHLQPGTLEDLYILSQTHSSTVLNVNGIIGMEQWKQATELCVCDFPLTLNREATAHFAEVSCDVETFDIEDLKYMISNFLREDGWVHRSVTCWDMDYAAIKHYLSQYPQVEVRRGIVLGEITTFEIVRDGFKCRVRFQGSIRGECSMVLTKIN